MKLRKTGLSSRFDRKRCPSAFPTSITEHSDRRS